MARRFEALGYAAHAAALEAALALVERLAVAHIEHVALVAYAHAIRDRGEQ